MIVFNLSCKDCNTYFEGWFASAKSCDSQIKKNMVKCVTCSSSRITKELSRPNVGVKSDHDLNTEKVLIELKKKVREVKKFVQENCDYVGDQFAYEARRIHYDNSKKKPIYGSASKSELINLKEEGINVSAIPWIEDEN